MDHQSNIQGFNNININMKEKWQNSTLVLSMLYLFVKMFQYSTANNLSIDSSLKLIADLM